ncbi:MAG: type II secretion system F family protein [Aeromonas popoffii]|uniref:type II secretion system F family protein n=1 Tax=Aeromonas popoffii TaxID=70856 RepID=UPI003F33D5A7
MVLFYIITVLFGVLLLAAMVIKKYMVIRLAHRLQEKGGQVRNNQTASADASNVFATLVERNGVYATAMVALDNNLKSKLIIVLGLGLLLFLVNLSGIVPMSREAGVFAMMLSLAVVIIFPGIIRKMVIKKKLKKILNDLPYFIDLVAVCVQSGMTVEHALKQTASSFVRMNSDLAILMDNLVRHAEVNGMASALKELYGMVSNHEMKMFCTTLQQSVLFGSSVFEQLIELSKNIREIQLLSTEEKIGSLSAKMSVPLILFIMFPIVILIIAPGVLRIMQDGLG